MDALCSFIKNQFIDSLHFSIAHGCLFVKWNLIIALKWITQACICDHLLAYKGYYSFLRVNEV